MTGYRSTRELEQEGTLSVLFQTFWRMPLIYCAMFLARGLSIALFKPLFDLAGSGAPTPVLPPCFALRSW